jgi:uncharacterized protein YebE (UPF0316 family)
MQLTPSELYTYVYLPLLIFFARMTDVTLMTLRIIFVSRGKRYLAPLLGFVEVFIWIAVVSQVIRGANNLVAYLAYAAGFAAGNYIGIYIENRLAIGTLVVRAIVQTSPRSEGVRPHSEGASPRSEEAVQHSVGDNPRPYGEGVEELVAQLYRAGYGVTTVDGQGATGPVKLVYTVIKRKDLPRVMEIMHRIEPRPFITVEEVRSAEAGVFPENATTHRSRFWRKGK